MEQTNRPEPAGLSAPAAEGEDAAEELFFVITGRLLWQRNAREKRKKKEKNEREKDLK